MKPTTMIVSAFAALAAAAPTEKKIAERGFANFLGGGNQFTGFGQVNLDYIWGLSGIANFDILQQLALQQNLGLGQFDALFNLQAGVLDLNSILLMQQLFDLQAFAQLGVLTGFDLAQLNLQNAFIDTGLLNLGGVNLNQFIPQNVVTQVQTVATQTFVLKE